MNTWGIYSINATTFNTHMNRSIGYPKEIRDKIYTALKINNLLLNILGYVSGARVISGCIRMAIAVIVLVRTLTIGDPTAKQGIIIGAFYKEAVWTAVAQFARGALEALPQGLLVNLAFDIIASPWNIYHSAHWHESWNPPNYEYTETFVSPITNWKPMKKPRYPLMFEPLHVV